MLLCSPFFHRWFDICFRSSPEPYRIGPSRPGNLLVHANHPCLARSLCYRLPVENPRMSPPDSEPRAPAARHAACGQDSQRTRTHTHNRAQPCQRLCRETVASCSTCQQQSSYTRAPGKPCRAHTPAPVGGSAPVRGLPRPAPPFSLYAESGREKYVATFCSEERKDEGHP